MDGDSAGLDLPVNQIVYETELLDHRRRNDERIEVVLAHGAAHAVDRKHEGEPRVEELLDAIREVGIEIHGRRVIAHLVDDRQNRHP
jgi:hypothetical protein